MWNVWLIKFNNGPLSMNNIFGQWSFRGILLLVASDIYWFLLSAVCTNTHTLHKSQKLSSPFLKMVTKWLYLLSCSLIRVWMSRDESMHLNFELYSVYTEEMVIYYWVLNKNVYMVALNDANTLNASHVVYTPQSKTTTTTATHGANATRHFQKTIVLMMCRNKSIKKLLCFFRIVFG